MNQGALNFAQKESEAVRERKPLLPMHRGEARYQAALDRDLTYREMSYAAIAISLFAGSGFGHLPSVEGALRSALLCIASGGFAVRAVALRYSPPEERSTGTKDPTMRLIVGTMIGFGLLGSAMTGVDGLIAILIGVGILALILLSTLVSKARGVVYFLCWAALIAISASPSAATGSGSPASSGLGFGLGIVLGGLAIATNWKESSNIQPTMVLSSMAAFAWMVLTIGNISHLAWNPLFVLIECVGVVILGRAVTSRSSFAPILILVVFIHLSGVLAHGGNLLDPVAPQIIVVILEFSLLGMASYRHAQAALSRFPLSTYRSSPQCLVAALDHAWDHPLKIDAL